MPIIKCSTCGEIRSLPEGINYAYCHRCGAKIGPENVMTPPAPVPMQGAQPQNPPVSGGAYQVPAQPAQPAQPIQPVQPAQPAQPAQPSVYQPPMYMPVYQAPPVQPQVSVYPVSAPYVAPAMPSEEELKRDAQRRTEKKELFRRGILVGAALTAFVAMQFVFSFILAFVEEMLGESTVNDLYAADGGSVYDGITYVFFSPLVFVVTAIVFFAILRIKPSKVVDFSMPRKAGLYFGSTFLCLGVVFPAMIITSVINTVLNSLGLVPTVGDEVIPQTWQGIALYILSTAFIPALCEEIFCRGLVLGSLRKYGDRPAIIVSTVVFSLMHANFVQIPYTFIFGFAMGYVTVKSESIWPAVTAHFVNNLMSCVLSLVTVGMSDEQASITILAYYGVTLALGLAGVFMIKAKRGITPKVNNEYGGVLTVGERVKGMIINPTFIIFAAFCLFSALLNMIPAAA
ncbi:MAG: CPBP family intramembrane metalloprotease [Clostridia bacterium]|nr:CPBP family intramembrane metalloprotease [Clostridia bacterium]